MIERIVWTVLPNGIADGHLRLSVFIAPQLDPSPQPAKLATFANWLDWPAVVAGLEFQVSFGSASGTAATVAGVLDPASSAPDSNLWSRLFGADTPLAVFQHKKLDKRVIRSFPAANIVSYLEKPYRACAVDSATRTPPIHILADPDSGFGRIVRPEVLRRFAAVDRDAAMMRAGSATGATARSGARSDPGRSRASARTGGARRIVDAETQTRLIADLRRDVARELEPKFSGRKFIRAAPVDPENDFLQARLFQLPKRTKRLPDRIQLPDMDFHRQLSILGQHPELLRRTGLVVDLRIPLSGPGAPLGLAGQGQVWLSLASQPAGAACEFPRTEYAFNPELPGGAAFHARPGAGSDLANRLLAAGGKRFEVLQMDVDGAAQKAVQLADNIYRTMSPRHRTTGSAETVSMPSLRSAGLSLVRTGRAELLHTAFIRARSHREAIKTRAPVSLFAEDLMRGYRVDVFDGSNPGGGAWRSLCRRLASYTLTDDDRPIAVQDEEGWAATATTEAAAAEASEERDLYVQESLFRWSGWSLVTPRPGKLLDDKQEAARARHQPGTGLPLLVETRAAPGSLPKLRFGAAYRLRARAVDLAGNSLSLDDADRLPETVANQTATYAVTYRRHEVITQPVLRLRRTLDDSGPGEGMERLVLRSFNKGAVQPEERVADSELSPDRNERHVAPPGTGQLTAECHGRFDGPQGPSPATYAAIVGHEGEFDRDVYSEDRLEVPYLADPPARGAAFVGLPGSKPPDNTVTLHRADGRVESWRLVPEPRTPVSVVQVEYGPSPWPDNEPFRLRAVATQTGRDPEWDPNQRILTVFVRPGETVPVRYSSFPATEDLGAMAAWQWIQDAGRVPQLEGRVLAGLHWMLTPYRELTLVHAVQRPLVKPEFQSLASHRIEGQTSADLEDRIPLSGKSTSRLDVRSRWLEPVDEGEAPRWVERAAHAFDMTIEAHETEAKFGPHRRLTRLPVRQVLERPSLAKAAKRVEAVPPEVRVLRPEATAPRARRQVQRSGTFRPIGRVERARPEQRRLPAQAVSLDDAEIQARTRTLGRHEFGDTKHRPVTYTAVASSRYRDDLPLRSEDIDKAEAEGGDHRVTRRSEPITIDVLSAARPAAPAVAYVIPTFGWESASAGAERTSTRRGGGLRVYLERPWFSSGEGELLGVLVPRQSARALNLATARRTMSRRATGVDAAELDAYLTHWGIDPIWGTNPPGGASPGLSSFRNAAATESEVALVEIPDARVAVAGFTVGARTDGGGFTGYDAERGLWYADLEIDPGESYFPFIRLALVRYQPKSIAWSGGDLKLSRVVIADFAQLAPDRTATITQRSATELSVTVSGVTAKESGEQKFGAVASVRRPDLERAASAPSLRSSATARVLRPPTDVQAPVAGRRPSIVAGPEIRVLPAASTGGNSVEVSLETLVPGGSDLEWMPVPDSTVELTPGPALGRRANWRGTVPLPEARGAGRYRLVIKEYEWFVVDGPDVQVGNEIRKPTAPRLVYADVLEI